MVDVLRWIDVRRLRGTNVENPAEEQQDLLPALDVGPPSTESDVDTQVDAAHGPDPAPSTWADDHLPSTTGVDRAAMAELVHRALPPLVADKLTRCRSWPGLAKRLEAWKHQGLPVDAMLESLPVWGIKLHPRPAVYTTNLMRKSVDKQLADVPFAAYASAMMTADHGGSLTTLAPGRTDTGSDQVGSDAELPGTGTFDSQDAIERGAVGALLELEGPEHLTSAEEVGADEQKAADGRLDRREEYVNVGGEVVVCCSE